VVKKFLFILLFILLFIYSYEKYNNILADDFGDGSLLSDVESNYKENSGFKLKYNSSSYRKLIDDLQAEGDDFELESIVYRHLASKVNLSDERKSDFANELKYIIYSDFPDSAKGAAIVAYSRLGRYGDLHEVLRYGKNNHLISEDDYYGELVQMIPTGFYEKDDEIINELIVASNDFGNNVLMSQLSGNPAVFLYLTDMQKKILHQYIFSHKPELPQNFSELGLLDAIRYEKWLGSLFNTSIESMEGDVFLNYVSDFYVNGFSDPRDAVLLGHADFIDEIRGKNPELFNMLVKTVEKYYDSYSNNILAEYLVREFKEENVLLH
jgi:hypothetical protein